MSACANKIANFMTTPKIWKMKPLELEEVAVL